MGKKTNAIIKTGFIEREDNRWLKKVQNLAIDGYGGRGRPRKTWEHVIMEETYV